MGDGDRLWIAVPEGDGDLDEVLCALALDSALTLDFRSPLGYLVASVVRALDCAGRFQYVWSPNPFVVDPPFVVDLVVLVVFEVFIRQLYLLCP